MTETGARLTKLITRAAGLVRRGSAGGIRNGNFADYELEERLGSGVSGTVWRATRKGRPGSVVAIKQCKAGASRDDMDRLRREGEVLSELDHPHTMKVLEIIDADDGVAIVMQHAAGGSLEDLVAARGPLPADQVVAILAPIADAMGSAHRRSVVHGHQAGEHPLHLRWRAPSVRLRRCELRPGFLRRPPTTYGPHPSMWIRRWSRAPPLVPGATSTRWGSSATRPSPDHRRTGERTCAPCFAPRTRATSSPFDRSAPTFPRRWRRSSSAPCSDNPRFVRPRPRSSPADSERQSTAGPRRYSSGPLPKAAPTDRRGERRTTSGPVQPRRHLRRVRRVGVRLLQ